MKVQKWEEDFRYLDADTRMIVERALAGTTDDGSPFYVWRQRQMGGSNRSLSDADLAAIKAKLGSSLRRL